MHPAAWGPKPSPVSPHLAAAERSARRWKPATKLECPAAAVLPAQPPSPAERDEGRVRERQRDREDSKTETG